MLPLIDNSIYSAMARFIGGEPVLLDRSPVAQRDIFSLAVKYDKSRLILIDSTEPHPRSWQLNNLRNRLALAFHNYHDVHNRFPPALEKHVGTQLARPSAALLGASCTVRSVPSRRTVGQSPQQEAA